MSARIEWPQLLAGLRRGDSQSERAFWEQYGPVLNGVAHRRLPVGLRARIDPADVVQSVCRTFLRRLHAGSYEETEGGDLKSLLCAITVNKVLMKTRFHLAAKRDMRRESADAPHLEDRAPAYAVVDSSLTPAEAAEFSDEMARLFASFTEEERRIVELKLAGHSHQEIAAALHRTDRWVRKVLERLRQRLTREVAAQDEAVSTAQQLK